MTREIAGRQWWPSDYMDEVMPTSFATPEGWLRPLPNGDGGFTIASPYHDDPAEEAERAWPFSPLTDGEKVEFCYCDDLGDIEMSIAADGTYEIHSGTVHPKATHFHEWFNVDAGWGDTIEEFAKNYAAETGTADRIQVGMADWSGSQTFSVKIEGGNASLDPAGVA